MSKAISILLTLIVLIILGFTITGKKSNEQQQTTYEENWESIQKYEVPLWFNDTKLGIFVEWGIYNVPAIKSPNYARWMDLDSVQYNAKGKIINYEPHPLHQYHLNTWGGKKEYEDFLPQLHYQQFDAFEWVNLFKTSGAKYVVAVAEHHDGFALYNSHHTKFNALQLGPKRDLAKELLTALKSQKLKTGLSSHYAHHWNFYPLSKGPLTAQKLDQAVSKEFMQHWWNRTTDIIDQYQPDILWFDFFINRNEFKPYHEKLAAYYYNKGIQNRQEVVLQTQSKNKEAFPAGTNILNYNYSKIKDIVPGKWQANIPLIKYLDYTNGIGKQKKTKWIIEDFIDVISKNGNVLLHVFPNADGTISTAQKDILMDMGEWIQRNEKAIYGSKPWTHFGEGALSAYKNSMMQKLKSKYEKEDKYRFTVNNGKLYLFLMNTTKDGFLRLPQFRNSLMDNVSCIKVLGEDKKVEWKQTQDALIIYLPQEKTKRYTQVYEIEFDQKLN
ncbi:alpha-L-fucosidase [Flammeovirga pacifica]|uniref:alpha-L-fucosidase n=1 Tax=Flammeovirga pacifica TaxID=915059 RepID=A0A1S1YSW3_FLAPC|nr:alpha-L-fucosidase [Flammeovirga pacifica]OHX64122.1 hypothetical protein NH26_21180 [Flammeovirga pacifica]